jgi:hypothetical protein
MIKKQHKNIDSVYCLQELTNTVIKWTSVISVCLMDLEVDSRFWGW